jgi:DNA-directed RNA polymerase sigma subunit (sigma70/sigma32)
VEEYLGLDGEKHTFPEIAERLGMTTEKIKEMYNTAIKKLRIGYDNSMTAVFE